MSGTIATLKEGFGFLNGDDSKAYFFHRNDLVNMEFHRLSYGDIVRFEPAETEKGLKAVRVEIVDSAR